MSAHATGRGEFRHAALRALGDEQLGRNLGAATATIRRRRAEAVSEVPDWEALREAGERIKTGTLGRLDEYLLQFEAAFQAAGGTVHWARDGDEANRIIVALVRARDARGVVKVKSLTTDEIGLNDALQAAGVAAVETDLAELIVQLAGETSSHILVPAIHKNRTEIRDLFRVSLGLPDLSDDPPELAEAARLFLRRRFLEAEVGISGANFAIAQTGTLCVVESEGNGRMCTTLPPVLISLVGVEKLLPSFADLEVFLQLLSRSATGERMSPYTTLWTGATAGDGPREVHVVLIDNGRTATLADEVGRAALRCIRCSACLNVCPVYSRTGGHAYGSVYPGPIGAILAPQLGAADESSTSLPWASSLCGACYEVCPVKIDIPEVLVHLRSAINAREGLSAEAAGMRGVAWAMGGRRRYEWAQRLARLGQRPFVRGGTIRRLPGPLKGWTVSRDLEPLPRESFRDWWRRTR